MWITHLDVIDILTHSEVIECTKTFFRHWRILFVEIVPFVARSSNSDPRDIKTTAFREGIVGLKENVDA